MLQLLLIDIMSVGISLGGPDEKQDIDQRRLLISHLDS
jgi:glucokinase